MVDVESAAQAANRRLREMIHSLQMKEYLPSKSWNEHSPVALSRPTWNRYATVGLPIPGTSQRVILPTVKIGGTRRTHPEIIKAFMILAAGVPNDDFGAPAIEASRRAAVESRCAALGI